MVHSSDENEFVTKKLKKYIFKTRQLYKFTFLAKVLYHLTYLSVEIYLLQGINEFVGYQLSITNMLPTFKTILFVDQKQRNDSIHFRFPHSAMVK